MSVAGWFARLDPPPDVFAVVMGTAIVSIAADQHAYWRIGAVLGVLSLVAFVLLGVGLLARVAAQPRRVVRVTRDPDVALRMFTFVAACTVLAVRYSDRGDAIELWWVLGGLGLAGWLVLMPLAVLDVTSRTFEQLRGQAHGAWLLPSVATTGLAIVTAELAVRLRVPLLVWVAMPVWLLGVLIYLAVTALIGWRALAAPFVPREAAPDSWILMGALAISALAGTHILTAAHTLGEPAGMTRGGEMLTLGAWIVASLWIPPLLYAQLWRADHVPGGLRYHGVWWSGMFPIGMYSAASSATAHTLRLPALATISLVFFWIAFAIWTILALGLVHTSLARLTR
jgi:tellurite resistance protein TehA-like permease